jgi:hypothetical protein
MHPGCAGKTIDLLITAQEIHQFGREADTVAKRCEEQSEF